MSAGRAGRSELLCSHKRPDANMLCYFRIHVGPSLCFCAWWALPWNVSPSFLWAARVNSLMLALPSCTLSDYQSTDTRLSENNFLPFLFNSQNTATVRIATKNREDDTTMTALWIELTDSDIGYIWLRVLKIFSWTIFTDLANFHQCHSTASGQNWLK